MKKKVLLIDNENVSAKITELQRKIKDADFEQINIGSSKLTEVLTNKRIDLKKVENYYKEKYPTTKPHLICFDYELGPEDITGLDILITLKPLSGRTQFLFYSSKIQKILDDILRKYRDGGLPYEKAKELLLELINSKIEGFVGRGGDLADAIGRILSKRRETLDDIFEEKIYEYQGYKTDYFDNLEIRDIVQLLHAKDGKSLNFKRELIEQFVSYLVRIQDEE